MRDTLAEGLKLLSLDFTKERILSTFLDEILLFNPQYGLVGSSDEEEIIVKHILDSAAGVNYISSLGKKDLIDVGSGAGFPGVVIASLLPDLSVTLAERMSRRVSFLKNLSLVLRLENVKVEGRDAEDIGAQFDIVTARAFRPLADVYPVLASLLRDGGFLVLYKGPEQNIRHEMEDVSAHYGKMDYDIVPLDVPFLDEERNLLVIQR